MTITVEYGASTYTFETSAETIPEMVADLMRQTEIAPINVRWGLMLTLVLQIHEQDKQAMADLQLRLNNLFHKYGLLEADKSI